MKSFCKITKYGHKFWTNEKGKLHRENGPAKEYKNGGKEYWINGKLHRLNGPAKETNEYKVWFQNGKRHRADGPTYYCKETDDKEWWLFDYQINKEEFDSWINRIQETYKESHSNHHGNWDI